ncbi:MAG: hypothetical protein ACTSQJ_02235 [Promethearchaeota archaeon]
MTMCSTIEVRAKTTYSNKLKEDDEFIWEIKELNLHQFKKVFGFEPAYEVGDQAKKTILKKIDVPSGWVLTVEEHDYKSNFAKNGTIAYYTVYKNPSDYDENIFIPSPAGEYLSEASKTLPPEYTVKGTTVTKKDKGPNGDKYTMEKKYTTNGVLVSEKYTDDDGIVLIHVKGTFQVIPSSNYFFGFMITAISGIVFVMIKKKKYCVNFS